MVQECTIRRKTTARATATGGKVATWADLYTGVACLVQGNNSYEARIAARETGVAQFKGMFPIDTDLKNGDRLSWTDPNTGTARRLTVKGTPLDEAGMGSHLMVSLEEWKGGGTW